MSKLSEGQRAALDNADGLFTQVAGISGLDAQTRKEIARITVGYGLKCWMDGERYGRRERQKINKPNTTKS